MKTAVTVLIALLAGLMLGSWSIKADLRAAQTWRPNTCACITHFLVSTGVCPYSQKSDFLSITHELLPFLLVGAAKGLYQWEN